MDLKFWVPVGGTVLMGVAIWFVNPASMESWAACVQAAGVLLAIGWSVRLQNLHANQGSRQAAQVAVVFAANMHWAFRELNDACIKRSWTDFVVNRRILDEILSQGREVSLPMLEGRTLAMMSDLRAIGVEALELTLPHTPEGNWRHLQSYFDKRLPNIAAWLIATGNPPEANGPTDYRGLRTSFSQLGPL
ncbi:hypothetical protein QTH91_05820 [Variovorax dokdonensis]|uniref:Uncharacterized protein n=1 Tax=Variovorax dokdonensis TaxID=344883 RepID=A0ABT7N7T0_9BURK|nr:hypothetical protein [Variovorax dokdonensis]MDM0043991.1 hypothetical protein [Variovorax dokdonensis]